LIRIKQDFDGLSVRTVIAVCGVGHIPSGVSNARGDHTFPAPDEILHAPEAASGKNCAFLFHAMSST
jgi:hypothetical protein